MISPRSITALGVILFLFSCRNEERMADTAATPAVRLEGIYQMRGESRQELIDCRGKRRANLEDTPGEELRRQCGLFDNPPGTVLWLDLEGVWRTGNDSIFTIRRINRIERRSAATLCR